MLRELAAAARDEIPAQKFNSILCDRTLRAMSAEGVVIWESSPNTEFGSRPGTTRPGTARVQPTGDAADNSNVVFRPVARLGSVTDRNIDRQDPLNPSVAWLAHQSLLTTIASDGEPVVVPSTPDVTEPQVPANPAPVPAALVPIDCSGNSSHSNRSPSRLIEVFLEPDGGIATQRGYLRFVCQVADLAGEYYRAEQLRSLLWHQALAEQCDRLIAKFHEIDHSEKLATLVVDELAEIFQLDRVAICRIETKSKNRIIAVSHVQTIDHRSDSADQIRSVCGETLDADGVAWLPGNIDSASENLETNVPASEDTATDTTARLTPLFAASGMKSGSNQRDHGYRLAGFRLAGKQADSLQPFEQRELSRTIGQALRSMQQIDLSRQSRWLRLVNRSSTEGHPSLRLAKRIASFSVIATVIACIMIIPVPKTIEAPATLRAEDTQRIFAIGDAVVETIRVEHGQHVHAGDVLMTLSDSKLEQQITTLMGRRAILAEQKIRLTEDMVDSSASDFESYEEIQGQRSVVDEEIASVNQQLTLLQQTNESLVIRSDREGVVDAWQINKRLSGRPVNRGDSLLQVVSHDSAWLVDAEVSQSRIERVRRADEDKTLSASVTIDDAPGRSRVANQWQFGPTSQASSSSNRDQVKTSVTLSIVTEDETPSEIGSSTLISRTGSPARVYFQCGSVPLGDLLVGDLVRDVRSYLALHWQFPDAKGTESF